MGQHMARIAQRAQVATNCYYDGCIGKVQPAGHMEIRRCIGKMHVVQERLASVGKVLRQQQRVVSGRAVTDSEVNGVYRLPWSSSIWFRI